MKKSRSLQALAWLSVQRDSSAELAEKMRKKGDSEIEAFYLGRKSAFEDAYREESRTRLLNQRS